MTTSLASLARTFGRIGVLSFGGPAAQIALMHRALVEEHRWFSERQFLSALSFCMLLPGPEAMQLATYAGWRLRGTWGGVISGTLFVLPGALVIAALALLYARFGARPETEALMLGVKAAVIVIVVQALIRLSQKALKSLDAYILAGLSFLAIFALDLPFPIIIAAAALYGYLSSKSAQEEPAPPPTQRTSPWTLAAWAALWLLPLPLLWASGNSLLFDLAAFFAKLAVVTFGGAYAVLAYMAQEVVEMRGWLDATQMVDALGLAETTPGPLILVTQFVGMLIAHEAGGVGLAMVGGLLTLWMTFVPCFLWIFAGAPYVEGLLARPRLQSALSAITAAVVGVILNLSLWFAFHVVFTEVAEVMVGPLSLDLPGLASPRWRAWPLIALAALLLGVLRCGIPLTLLVCALAGAGLSQL